MRDYHQWDQKAHAQEWMIFPKNLGPQLSIDETSLSNGELYTIIAILKRIPEKGRCKVEEITLDMAGSMNQIARHCFPRAARVTDRFQIQKLAYDALQEMRIALRWDAINEETNAIDNARWEKVEYVPFHFENGDSKKQLLARSRYLLFKLPDKWSQSQKQRAKILFAQYPDIQKAFCLTHKLRLMFSKTKDKGLAYTKLAQWYNEVTESRFKAFNTISAAIYTHYKRDTQLL